MRPSIIHKKPQNIFTAFLDVLEVKYTNSFSNRYFNEHPYKYSLFGLSKMLSEYNIENAAIKIKDKEAGLLEIEVPFIAHIGSDFVVVTKITHSKIEYLWNGKDVKISHDDFLKIWTGVVLLAEPDSNSKEPDFDKNLTEKNIFFLKKTVLSIAAILLSFITYLNQPLHSGIGFNLLLLANIIGIYISYLLAQKQVKVQSNYADKICSLFNQSDCNSILESDASKFFGILSWSEIGIGYFIANTSILLFSPHLMPYMVFINICVLPYTIWSIWYQKFKAKQWCPLCLIVQGLLWIIFIIDLIFGIISLPSFKLSDILISACLYVIPILAVDLFISALSQSENIEQIRQEMNSIKATDEVFVSLLKKQPHYEVAKDTSQILFGNPDADILVTILTNPHCNPCSKMHKRIEKILTENNENICIQYIFSSFDESLYSSNLFLISAYINKPIECEKIISNWFENGKNDKNNFFKRYDLQNTQIVLNEFEKHKKWKEDTGLRATPTILVNGYKLPDNYKIEDLKYFTTLVYKSKLLLNCRDIE